MLIAEEHLTKTERIYKYLESEILNGNLRPGTRLIVKNICETLGVSDSPVREALKLLEATDMIQIVPYIGAVVITPSADWVYSIFVMRAAVEGMATYTAIPYIDDEQLEKITAITREMNEFLQEKNYAQYALLDRQLHTLLYEKSPHAVLLQQINDLWKKSEYGKAIFGMEPEALVDSSIEHDQIIEAIRTRNAEEAQLLVQKQKLRVGRQLKALILKNHEGKAAE